MHHLPSLPGRGFSRSHLTGAQDYAHRMERDADDVADLIKKLSPNEPAFVLGNSSGAQVALAVLERHADLVKAVLVHEPPAHSLLPEFAQIKAGSEQLYQLYRSAGIVPALQVFAQAVKLNEQETAGLMEAMNSKTNPYAKGNTMYWFEREVPTYPLHVYDLEKLDKEKGKLVLVCGEDTDPEAGHFRPNTVLAEKLGLELKKLPGGHLGAISHAEAFGKRVKEMLKG
jgi:acetyltransferase/esterase